MRPGGGLRRAALAAVGLWLLELARVVAIAAAAVAMVVVLVALGLWGHVGGPP